MAKEPKGGGRTHAVSKPSAMFLKLLSAFPCRVPTSRRAVGSRVGAPWGSSGTPQQVTGTNKPRSVCAGRTAFSGENLAGPTTRGGPQQKRFFPRGREAGERGPCAVQLRHREEEEAAPPQDRKPTQLPEGAAVGGCRERRALWAMRVSCLESCILC